MKRVLLPGDFAARAALEYYVGKVGGIMRIHFIEEGEMIVAFFPDTLKFYQINSFTKDVLQNLLLGYGNEEIIEKFNLNSRQFDGIMKLIDNNQSELNVEMQSKSLFLDKLVLNITNTCNLACKYCYANGGSYSSKSALMNPEQVEKILDVFYSEYKIINNIQLFGGEPTLNLDAIEKVGEYIEKRVGKGELKVKPIISIVTNGTNISDRFIELINSYGIHVTVSIDGPQKVNDAMRIFKDGKGTGKIIEQNIKLLKEKTRTHISAEVTYNEYHQSQGMSVYDVVSYIQDELKIKDIHIAPVSGKGDSDYVLKDRSSIVDSVKDVFEGIKIDLNRSYSLINRVIEVLHTKKTSKFLCGAGISMLSVSTKGDVYPCFMLTDIDEFKMGNVNQKELFDHQFSSMKNKLESFSKFEHEKCKDCFSNKICSGCVGMNYFETGDIHEQSDKNCDMYRRIVETVILELTKQMTAKARIQAVNQKNAG
ncbi:MAG: Anaerobic sulfatase-maturating enzyme [Firmicutes bacterium ADurb.Bin419]|nr:MAG: Anaerobic sulfatase-maturating enzyme [Firmicutes bacterium ADurb.Bin419]